MQDTEKIWHAALGELELQMTKSTFNTWIKPTVVVSWDRDTVVLGAPNGYIKDWLQNRLHTPIQRTLSGIAGHDIDVEFIVWTEEQNIEQLEELPLLKTASSTVTTNSFRHNNSIRNGNGHMPLNPCPSIPDIRLKHLLSGPATGWRTQRLWP
jgi:chromosomal replication initiation ATPase DnaA